EPLLDAAPDELGDGADGLARDLDRDDALLEASLRRAVVEATADDRAVGEERRERAGIEHRLQDLTAPDHAAPRGRRTGLEVGGAERAVALFDEIDRAAQDEALLEMDRRLDARGIVAAVLRQAEGELEAHGNPVRALGHPQGPLREVRSQVAD